MNGKSDGFRRGPILGLIGTAGVIVIGSVSLSLAQPGDADAVPPETSINALMVALIDHAAHEIWEHGSAVALTGRDWQTVEQHAIQLVASGTLVSLGGTGREDMNWAMQPAWQQWSRALSEAGLAVLAAVEDTDQAALRAAGERLIDTCFGCHDAFKPDAPTEGLMHVPHYED